MPDLMDLDGLLALCDRRDAAVESPNYGRVTLTTARVRSLIQRVRELEGAVTETRRLLLGRAHYFEEGRGEFTKVSLDEIHAVLKDVGAPL